MTQMTLDELKAIYDEYIEVETKECIKCTEIARHADWCYIGALASAIEQLDKWQNWKPDDNDLREAKKQAKARDGSYQNSLAASAVYIGVLEAKYKDAIEQIEEVQEKYYELLWGVSVKHPDETRHETALRYITQAEQGSIDASQEGVAHERHNDT